MTRAVTDIEQDIRSLTGEEKVELLRSRARSFLSDCASESADEP